MRQALHLEHRSGWPRPAATLEAERGGCGAGKRAKSKQVEELSSGRVEVAEGTEEMFCSTSGFGKIEEIAGFESACLGFVTRCRGQLCYLHSHALCG